MFSYHTIFAFSQNSLKGLHTCTKTVFLVGTATLEAERSHVCLCAEGVPPDVFPQHQKNFTVSYLTLLFLLCVGRTPLQGDCLVVETPRLAWLRLSDWDCSSSTFSSLFLALGFVLTCCFRPGPNG